MSDARQPTGTDVIRDFIPQSPLVGHLGLELVELGDGVATMRAPFRDELATIGNTVHGGAIATLIDTCAMAASWSGAEVPENLRGSTVGLTINFLAPAAGEDVEARARVVRRGRRLVTVEVDASTPEGKLVAKALVTYQLG